MDAKLGVIILHGMGTFPPPEKPATQGKHADPFAVSYSSRLHRKIRQSLGAALFDASVEWAEIYYGAVLRENQESFLSQLPYRATGWRRAVVERLGDPAAYALSGTGDPKNVYAQTRDEIEWTMQRLTARLPEDAPIVVLAHSLGGQVISNHIWDAQSNSGENLSDMPCSYTGMDRIAAIFTFGCNIPLFVFGLGFDAVKAISYPGAALASHLQLQDWWHNFYSPNDLLGYPLAPSGQGYAEMAETGILQEHRVRTGSLLTFWNTFSHTGYWNDRYVAQTVSGCCRELLR